MAKMRAWQGLPSYLLDIWPLMLGFLTTIASKSILSERSCSISLMIGDRYG